jgi:hypothetical protein
MCVQIETIQMSDIGLGKSIYIKKLLERFVTFQDSQGTRKAYLMEIAEIMYGGRNEKGEGGQQ